MGSIASALAIAAMLAVTGARTEPLRQLAEGPTLAGTAAVWTEYSDGESVIRRWRARLGTDELFRSATVTAQTVTGSARMLAFRRAYPGCPPSPGVVCPTVNDVVIGPIAGPFRPITGPANCFYPWDEPGLAVDGATVVYDVLDCERGRIRTLLRTTETSVLRDVPLREACCGPLRVAGRYVAWTEESNARVVVRDFAGRVHASVRAGDGVHGGRVSFDVQSDGTLAVLTNGRLLRTANDGRTHTIATGVPDGPVRIARNRIVYRRKTTVSISDLDGRTRIVARFRAPARLGGSLDFDGHRLVFASDVVAETWMDCPPPGGRRPCFRRERGTTTIWRAELPSLRPLRIASLSFSGVAAPDG